MIVSATVEAKGEAHQLVKNDANAANENGQQFAKLVEEMAQMKKKASDLLTQMMAQNKERNEGK
jgi:hypothetical protein